MTSNYHNRTEQAYRKMLSYCRLTPRSHQEIKERLYRMGLWKYEVDEILSRLIENDQVNEERYTRQFVAHQLRNNCGIVKIKNHLIRQKVSEYNIKHIMKTIDQEAYTEMVQKMASKKWNSIKGVGIDDFIKRKKTGDYLLQKGIESKLVNETLEKLKSGEIE